VQKNDSKWEAYLSYRVAIRLNCLILAKLRESWLCLSKKNHPPQA